MPPKKGSKKAAKDGAQPPSFLIARQLDQEKIHFLTTRIDVTKITISYLLIRVKFYFIIYFVIIQPHVGLVK
jgi:hypothetical protein